MVQDSARLPGGAMPGGPNGSGGTGGFGSPDRSSDSGEYRIYSIDALVGLAD